MSESRIVCGCACQLIGAGAVALSQCDSNRAHRKGARALQSTQTT
jgi:hypothetical protein